jgi:predicted enzyme related to lactoylglutathione lyase
MSQGRFVWHELMTTDTRAAKAFYGKVVGWGAQDMPMPGMTYTMLMAGQAPVGGLMDIPEDECAAELDGVHRRRRCRRDG